MLPASAPRGARGWGHSLGTASSPPGSGPPEQRQPCVVPGREWVPLDVTLVLCEPTAAPGLSPRPPSARRGCAHTCVPTHMHSPQPAPAALAPAAGGFLNSKRGGEKPIQSKPGNAPPPRSHSAADLCASTLGGGCWGGYKVGGWGCPHGADPGTARPGEWGSPRKASRPGRVPGTGEKGLGTGPLPAAPRHVLCSLPSHEGLSPAPARLRGRPGGGST